MRPSRAATPATEDRELWGGFLSDVQAVSRIEREL